MTSPEAAPRRGKLSIRERALHAAHGADQGYGSRHDFDKGFRAGWRAREAEAAAGTALDVERLEAALAAWSTSRDRMVSFPHDDAVSIAAEYARLAGVERDTRPVADASEDGA